MKLNTIGAPMRAFLIVAAAIIALGIWLTGYKAVHWVLYLPPAFFLFAAITGICPGMMVMNKLFGGKSG